VSQYYTDVDHITIYQTSWRHNAEDHSLLHYLENLIFIYDGRSNEVRSGIVLRDGIEAVKTVLLGAELGIPLTHQVADLLLRELPGILSVMYTARRSPVSGHIR
jgi:hypothetical protein